MFNNNYQENKLRAFLSHTPGRNGHRQYLQIAGIRCIRYIRPYLCPPSVWWSGTSPAAESPPGWAGCPPLLRAVASR